MFVGRTTFQQAVTCAWAPSSQGKLLASGTLDGGGVGFDEEEASLVVHELNLLNGSLVPRKQVKVQGSKFTSLAWGGEDGRIIAGGMTDGAVRLWKVDDSELEEKGHILKHDKGSMVRALQFSSALPNMLAHGSNDKRVMISDVSGSGISTSAVTEGPAQHVGEVSCVSWSFESPHILASSSMDGICSVWDTKSKKSAADIRDPRSASTVAVSFSPRTGYHLVTASDSGYVRLFDLRSSKTTPLAELQSHTAGIFDVSWCPHDPGYLASCGKDNRLLVWDLYTLQVIQEVTAEFGHSPKHGAGLGGAGLGAFERSMQPAGLGSTQSSQFSADNLFSSGANDNNIDFGGGSGASARRYQIDWSPSIPGLLTACSFDRSVQILSLVSGSSSEASSLMNGQKLRSPAWMMRRSGVSFGFGGRMVSVAPVKSPVTSNQTRASSEVVIKNCHPSAHTGDKAMTVGSRIAEFERGFNQALQHDTAPSHDHLAAFCAERARQCQKESEKEIWRFMRVLFEEENQRVAVQKFLGYDEEAVLREADLSFLPPAEVEGAGQHNGGYDDTETKEPSLETDAEPSPTDELITRALTIGNFEAAVALCFEHDRAADALFISSLGGAPLMRRAHRAYLDSQTPNRPVMRLARSIFNDNTQSTVVRDANLSKPGAWKQALAFLMSYTKPEDFSSQCDALALRLEREVQDLAAATVCYMLSRNVEKSGELWARLNPKDDVELVERAIVFQRVLPNPQSLNDDRLLMQRFARLAAKLTDEGEFDIAAKYATMASAADYDAPELVQRIQYGLKWTAASEEQALEAERAAAEAAEAEAQQQLQQHQEWAAQQAQQAAQQYQQPQVAAVSNNGYYDYYSSAQNSNPATATYGQVQADIYGNYSQSSNNMYATTTTMPQYAQPSAPSAAYPQPTPPAYQQHQAALPTPTYTPTTSTMYSAPASMPVAPVYAPPPPQYATAPTTFAPASSPPPPSNVGGLHPQHGTSMGLTKTIAHIPRVKENDGFGSTAGNPDAGAKYGNRTSGGMAASAYPQASHASHEQQQEGQAAPPKPPKVPDHMQPVLQSFNRLLNGLKAKYASGLEERRLREAERGEALLKAALAVGSLSDFAQERLQEMAAAFDRGAFNDAHNIQIKLSASSADWRDHKEWIRRLDHLVSVAMIESTNHTAPGSQPQTGPPSLVGSAPSYPSAPAYGGPSSNPGMMARPAAPPSYPAYSHSGLGGPQAQQYY